MRKFTFLLSALALTFGAAHAQTVATFDTLSLPGTDTSYLNFSHPGTDVGFNDGKAYFPVVFDTSGGYSYCSYGFSYSNRNDTVTSGYLNDYSAKTGIGYGGSSKYAVAFGTQNIVRLTGTAVGRPVEGLYVTNSTYAFNSVRDGDGFGKKFGGTTGNDADWFKLIVKGYSAGSLKADSVVFYLADFRFVHNDSDYIVNTWKWVNLMPLGNVDSLQFVLKSSDNSSGYMNTPAYFCMDNFTTHETVAGVNDLTPNGIKVYPNPVTDVLNVELPHFGMSTVTIVDMLGNIVACNKNVEGSTSIDLSALSAGVYLIKVSDAASTSTTRFIKK